MPNYIYLAVPELVWTLIARINCVDFHCVRWFIDNIKAK